VYARHYNNAIEALRARNVTASKIGVKKGKTKADHVSALKKIKNGITNK
jgi:hypothetical protein